VIVAEADFVPSLTDVAVIATVGGDGAGGALGAVHVTAAPDALVVAESEPQRFNVLHETDHVTPLFALSFATVAVNVCVFPVVTVAVVGVMLTATAAEPPPVGAVVLFDPPPQPVANATTSAVANTIGSTATNAAKNRTAKNRDTENRDTENRDAKNLDAKNCAAKNCSTAPIRRQLCCLCARDMTLPLFPGSRSAQT
jgi:hypothetical protein